MSAEVAATMGELTDHGTMGAWRSAARTASIPCCPERSGIGSYHLGIDLGQANDPTALSVIEDKQLPLPEYDRGGRQLLGERQLAVVHLERMEGRAYTQVARHIAALIQRAPLLGRVSTVIDGTGVGRAFTD